MRFFALIVGSLIFLMQSAIATATNFESISVSQGQKIDLENLVPIQSFLLPNKAYREWIFSKLADASEDPKVKSAAGALLQRELRNTVSSPYFNFTLSPLIDYAYANSGPLKLLQTDAYTNPTMRSNDGMFFQSGNTGWVGVDFLGSFFEVLDIRAQPYFSLFGSEGIEGHQSRYFIKEAYASLNIRNLQIQAGKIQTQWGSGRLNQMLFSRENEPMWMMKLSNSLPVTMPSFLEYLGPTRFEAFYALLDGRQIFPNSKLIGSFFSIMPHERIELGFGQTILFGGTGSPESSPLVFFSEKISDSENPANRNFVLSAKWRIPGLEIEPYADLMWEDCCNFPLFFNSRDMVNLVGVYFPNVSSSNKMDLTAEWVRTNEVSYRHFPYTSGLIYKNRPLGPTLGPDGSGVYVRLRYLEDIDYVLSLTFAYEIRARQEAASFKDVPIDIRTIEPSFESPDQRHRLDLESYFRWNTRLEVIPRLTFEYVTNRDYVRFSNHFHLGVGLSMKVSI